jgi:Holliday junction resolvasome RuvABC endonuclease subunit
VTRTPARRVAEPWSDLVVLGIDPSLTGTGVAVVKGGVLVKTEVLTSNAAEPLPARLTSLRLGVESFLMAYEPAVVAMETVAFGLPQQASALGAVQGALQVAIWLDLRKRATGERANGHFLSVNVSHVKKWVGAKQKNEILLQVYKQYGLTFADHNAADATVIAMIADAYLARQSGHDWACWTKPQQEVLKKLEATGYPWEAPHAKKIRKPKKGAA